ncbi:hypothetical protein KKC32_01955 [Patescibacteria group bacterium]|nr:hypothetical protein [Patescibacteria group bacterium]
MKKILALLLFSFFFLPFIPARAESKPINVYVFTEQGCSHCANVKSYLQTLTRDEFPGINVIEKDLRTDPDAYQGYVDFATAYGIMSATVSVPITYVGEKAIQGDVLREIHSAIALCDLKECKDPAQVVKEYFANNSNAKPTVETSSNQELLGYVIIGILIIGGIVIFLNKKS